MGEKSGIYISAYKILHCKYSTDHIYNLIRENQYISWRLTEDTFLVIKTISVSIGLIHLLGPVEKLHFNFISVFLYEITNFLLNHFKTYSHKRSIFLGFHWSFWWSTLFSWMSHLSLAFWRGLCINFIFLYGWTHVSSTSKGKQFPTGVALQDSR